MSAARPAAPPECRANRAIVARRLSCNGAGRMGGVRSAMEDGMPAGGDPMRIARFGSVSRQRGCALGVLLLAAATAWGQAAPPPPLSATKSFAPATILSGGRTTLTIRLANSDKQAPVSAIGFQDTFPSGMFHVAGADSGAQCGGSLTFGANAFTFAGGSLAAASFCDVKVTVTASSTANTTLTNVTSAIAYTFLDAAVTYGPVSGRLAVTGPPPPLIIVTPGPDLETTAVGGAADRTFVATGGTPPYTWAQIGGALPTGTALLASGTLTGSYTAAGTFAFDLRVTDSAGVTAVRAYRQVVDKYPGTLTVRITPNPAVSGQPLSVIVELGFGPSAPTGTIDAWLAGSGERCPAPFESGPLPETRQKQSAPAGPVVTLNFATPRIDDYRVCVVYGGDANHAASEAGPLDAFVIKGVLSAAPPAVGIAAADGFDGVAIPALSDAALALLTLAMAALAVNRLRRRRAA
jgi:hypothetical protein